MLILGYVESRLDLPKWLGEDPVALGEGGGSVPDRQNPELTHFVDIYEILIGQYKLALSKLFHQ